MLVEAESMEGQHEDTPYLDSQQATPNHRLEGFARIGYIRAHKIHCRVGRESQVKTCRDDGVVARRENLVMT